ncbi:DUF5829 family protein [Autumnicola musiva]|uniref:DUF5829 family protein n=1 Tax=Autumnicola musiva TaxID=3075589 RepID=A0ABU3DBG7_9FLAO|nr:DUF5829 family protein [Zunongwangia sp. F117]MDT0678710.1 DUF5829 family protein [Zunongwangia sp. F117]
MGCNQKTEEKTEYEIAYDEIDAALNNNSTPVVLDHFYITLDSSTYSNLKRSKFLQDSYASIDNGLPDFDMVESHTSSFYIRGEEHYIEILGPDNSFGEPVGRNGIGFLLDNDKDFHVGQELNISKKSGKFLTASDTTTYNINGEDVIWYQPFFTTGSIATELYTWYSYYNPGFINALYNKKSSKYERSEFLEPVYDDEKLFQAITAIELICTKADFLRIVNELHLLNQQLIQNKGSFKVRLNDIDLMLALDPELEKSYIKNIHCKLNREDSTSLNFGRFEIINSGKKSVWKFNDNQP